jgi:hypothetical protein
MRHGQRIGVVIPALDEERGIGLVVAGVPTWVDDIIVVDNGSRDRTAAMAEAAGARVVNEPQRGYGAACLAGIAALGTVDIVVFIDGDYSDHGDEMDRLVDPIIAGRADLVIGSRVRGTADRGALTPQQRFGNGLACLLIRWIWGVRFTDLGPFRAIRRSSLLTIGMRDRDYGWTVEMQIKAAQFGLACAEVPVSYRQRIGRSKVSGTVKGVVLAGTKILAVIALSALRRPKLK